MMDYKEWENPTKANISRMAFQGKQCYRVCLRRKRQLYKNAVSVEVDSNTHRRALINSVNKKGTTAGEGVAVNRRYQS
jgi:hypothetical protein